MDFTEQINVHVAHICKSKELEDLAKIKPMEMSNALHLNLNY